jgi:hypothetical protein
MKVVFIVVLCLFYITQVYCQVLSTVTTTLTSISNPVVGQLTQTWRQYVIGIASTQTTSSNSLLYMMLNGTSGVSSWVKLDSVLSSTKVLRVIWNTTNIGDIVQWTAVSTLNNGLKIKYLELDTRGALLYSNGVSLYYDGTADQGYAKVTVDVPSTSSVATTASQVTNSVGLINTLVTTPVSTLTDTLSSLLNLGGLLGGLGL